MNRLIKSGFLLFLGFVMLGWFVYSVGQPAVPSETYKMDRVMDIFMLIGAVAGFIGGILEFIRR
ncbi:MAG: hypothetical protein KF762_04225 [Acidobacteria bacterium]|nr:hypothetical protein [Acidobacteriota bacterium]